MPQPIKQKHYKAALAKKRASLPSSWSEEQKRATLLQYLHQLAEHDRHHLEQEARQTITELEKRRLTWYQEQIRLQEEIAMKNILRSLQD